MRKTILIAFSLFVIFAAGCVQADPIHDAAAKGDAMKVKSILDVRPSLVNSIDKDGATALHFAVAKGSIPAVKELIRDKADVNAAKFDGVTPLHVAAALGKKDIAECLISNKANVNAVDKKGRTPLDVAQANNKKELVALLLGRGAVNGSKVSVSIAGSTSVSNVLSTGSASSSTSSSSDIETEARNFMSLITSGDFKSAESKFDSTMKQQMPEYRLKQLCMAAVSQYGNFKQVNSVRTAKVQGYDVAYATCEFQKATFDVQITFNSSKQVAGLFLLSAK